MVGNPVDGVVGIARLPELVVAAQHAALLVEPGHAGPVQGNGLAGAQANHEPPAGAFEGVALIKEVLVGIGLIGDQQQPDVAQRNFFVVAPGVLNHHAVFRLNHLAAGAVQRHVAVVAQGLALQALAFHGHYREVEVHFFIGGGGFAGREVKQVGAQLKGLAVLRLAFGAALVAHRHVAALGQRRVGQHVVVGEQQPLANEPAGAHALLRGQHHPPHRARKLQQLFEQTRLLEVQLAAHHPFLSPRNGVEPAARQPHLVGRFPVHAGLHPGGVGRHFIQGNQPFAE